MWLIKNIQVVSLVCFFSLSAFSNELLLAQDPDFNFLFVGSQCYSYEEGSETSPDVFKCRRVSDTMYVDGLIESVMFDEVTLWGLPYGYSFVGQKPLKKIYLNSKGGLMFDHSGASSTAVDIMRLIKEKKIETHSGFECKSACVPVFVSGLKRIAKESTSFMVHSPRIGGAHLLFLKEKCGEKLQSSDCAKELLEIKERQILDMDLYFDLMEAEGVSFNLRNDYLSGEKNEKPYLNGNFIGYKDLYFTGVEALSYGVALSLIK